MLTVTRVTVIHSVTEALFRARPARFLLSCRPKVSAQFLSSRCVSCRRRVSSSQQCFLGSTGEQDSPAIPRVGARFFVAAPPGFSPSRVSIVPTEEQVTTPPSPDIGKLSVMETTVPTPLTPPWCILVCKLQELWYTQASRNKPISHRGWEAEGTLVYTGISEAATATVAASPVTLLCSILRAPPTHKKTVQKKPLSFWAGSSTDQAWTTEHKKKNPKREEKQSSSFASR